MTNIGILSGKYEPYLNIVKTRVGFVTAIKRFVKMRWLAVSDFCVTRKAPDDNTNKFDYFIIFYLKLAIYKEIFRITHSVLPPEG